MSKKIYFDLDGTVYNLYGLENWLELVEGEKVEAFTKGMPLFTERFYTLVAKLLTKGFQFGVITWLPMDATKEYESKCATAKEKWCKKFLPFVNSIVCQTYGTPKANGILENHNFNILIDDNKKVCEEWNTKRRRKSIHLTEDFNVEQALEKILTNC